MADTPFFESRTDDFLNSSSGDGGIDIFAGEGDNTDTEDPLGPSGQAHANNKPMFRTPGRAKAMRKIKSTGGQPVAMIPNMRPGRAI